MIFESWGFACWSFLIELDDKGNEEFHDLEIGEAWLCMDTGIGEARKP